MSEPLFLTVAQVERLQKRLIELFGGTHGMRDPFLIEGAVMLREIFTITLRAICRDIAAGYAFHIAQAQGFLDGNKRTGIAAALSLLEANGVFIPTSTDRLHEAMGIGLLALSWHYC
jgi:death-on-curing protein